jgi:thioesterase domain-containing protein
MLVPVQTTGAKAPIYFIHGLTGIMPLGRILIRSLGADRPFYAVNASGFGGEKLPSSVKDMAVTYAKEISEVQPTGPLLIAGMCAGGLAAMEVARELQSVGREIGPVILVDPPTPGGGPDARIPLRPTVDPTDPLVAAKLYERARGSLLQSASEFPQHEIPFATHDQRQMHLATLVAVNTLVVFCRHVPDIFPGPAVAILSAQRATAFFHPHMPWVKLLPRLGMAHVLPYDHSGLLRSGLHDLGRVFKFVLEGVMNSEVAAESAGKSVFMPA